MKKKQLILVEFLLFVLAFVLLGCLKPPPSPPPPVPNPMFSLTVDKDTVSPGETVTLSWVVPEGTQGRIEPIEAVVEGSGSTQVTVTQSQTFVLSGVVNGRKVETSVRVFVRSQ